MVWPSVQAQVHAQSPGMGRSDQTVLPTWSISVLNKTQGITVPR